MLTHIGRSLEFHINLHLNDQMVVKNIFTKKGQNKTIKDSNVYVMASELDSVDRRKLQNVSAFLKREE